MTAGLARLTLALWLAATAAVPAGEYGDVEFGAADGVALRGRLWHSGRTAVILSHMYGADQSSWTEFAGTLHVAGYAVLTYDFRGVGRSRGRLVIAELDRDVLGAIRFVRSQGARRVILVGASMGGTASLVAASRAPVDGVVVIASGTQWQGLDARPFLLGLQIPKLFIVGSDDAPFNHSTRVMYEQTLQPKQLLVLPTPRHGTLMLQTEHAATIERAILAFLEKYGDS